MNTVQSRRALLAGAPAAAAAALAGAAIVNADEVDPIFAAIAEHDAAHEAVLAALARFDEGEITEAAQARAFEAELPLFTTAPTTIAGAVALLAYLSRDAHDNPDETILVDATEWGPGEQLHGAVRAFPQLLAAALAKIEGARS